MLQNPVFKKRRKRSGKKKVKGQKTCDSLFSGFAVSRRLDLSPPHQKYFSRLQAKQNQPVKSDFHVIQNKFNSYQEQLFDKSRVEELNKAMENNQERGNHQGGIQMGRWVKPDETPRYKFQNFEEKNISKEVTTISNRKQKTPPRRFSQFKCSPKPNIFSKYKKVIPSVGSGEDIRSNSVEFTPRILSQMKFVKQNEGSEKEIDDLMNM